MFALPEATGLPVRRHGSGRSGKGMAEVIESRDLQAEPNRRELRTVLDAAPVALFWASLKDFNVRSANHAFTDRFGTLDGCFTSVEQWLDAACCHPEQRHRARILWQNLRNGNSLGNAASSGIELDLRCADGTIVTTLHRGTVDRYEGIAIATFEDISQCKAVEHALRRIALEDPLTELSNRRALTDRWQFELRWHESHPSASMAVLIIDLDRFKSVNDEFGHDAGDAVLKTVAARLRAAVPPTGTICRLGGDEFAVLLPGLSSPEEADQVSRRICAALSRPFMWEAKELSVGASLGISCYPQDAADLQTLMRYADQALYRRKKTGHGGWARFCHAFAAEDGQA